MRTLRKGFTLLEMIVAATLLVAVFMGIFGLINGLLKDLRHITTAAKQGREAPAIMALIEKDLVNAYADPRMPEMFSAEGGKDGTEMRFVTSRNSILFLDGVQSDITEVGYKVERNKQPGSRQLYTLYRREDFLMDDEPLEGGLWIPVADNIVEFQCTFFDLPDLERESDIELPDMLLGEDASEELDEWDKEDRYLPYAVKIVLTVDIREEDSRNDEESEAVGLQTLVSFVRLPPFSRNLPEEDDEHSITLNITPNASGTNNNESNENAGNANNGNANNGTNGGNTNN